MVKRLVVAAGVATVAALTPLTVTATPSSGAWGMNFELGVAACDAQELDGCIRNDHFTCPTTGQHKRYVQ